MKSEEIKRVVAVFAAFLSLVAKSSPLVPDLPKGSEAEILEVYRQAAEHGSPKAIFAMAYYSEHGIGMPANREEALKWYWKLCGLHGANPDGVQDEAAKAIDRLVGLSACRFPLIPRPSTETRFCPSFLRRPTVPPPRP